MRNPWRETRKVFVGPAWEACPPDPERGLRLVEFGFGRGLNTITALQSLAAIRFRGSVRAIGFEPFPQALRPWPACPVDGPTFAPWWGKSEGRWAVAGHADWTVRLTRQTACVGLASLLPRSVDWVFLDLFSPGKHPEQWPEELFVALRRVLHVRGVVTSYCCARSLRNALTEHGFKVERLHEAGRRDHLRARTVI